MFPILSWIIFPFGQAYRHPKDELHKSLLKAMLSPTELRDRLTKYCFDLNVESGRFGSIPPAEGEQIPAWCIVCRGKISTYI